MAALLVAVVPLVFAALRAIAWPAALFLALVLGVGTTLVGWQVASLVALPMLVTLLIRRRRRAQWRTADLGPLS